MKRNVLNSLSFQDPSSHPYKPKSNVLPNITTSYCPTSLNNVTHTHTQSTAQIIQNGPIASGHKNN